MINNNLNSIQMIKFSFMRNTIVAIIILMPALGLSQTMDFPGGLVPSSATHGRQAKDRITRISINFSEVPLEQALRIIASKASLKLTYPSEGLPKKIVIVSMDSVTSSEAFAKVLEGTGLRVQMVGATHAAVVVDSKSSVDTIEQRRKGQIVGMVIDSTTGEGISGVALQLQGIGKSVISDSKGRFIIGNISVGRYSLNAKIIGYQTQIISIVVESARETSVTIALRRTATSLSEVVTTATGQRQRREVANDIVRIDADAVMQRTPVRSLTDLISAAQVPGVVVTRSSGEPGAPSRIRMRGIGSISQNNDPVVMVDGVWINSATSTSDIQRKVAGGGSGLLPSRLDDIDPATIETIEFIRGPSAATMYGPDAANGVIVITTKRGNVGATRWSFNVNRDWTAPPGKVQPDYIGFGAQWDSDAVIKCSISTLLFGTCIRQDSVISIAPNDRFLRKEGAGAVQRYSIGLDGGTNTLRYALNGSVQDELGAERLPVVDQVRLRLLRIPVSENFIKPSRLSRRNVSMRVSASPQETVNLTLTASGGQSNLMSNGIDWANFVFIDPRDTLTVLSKDNADLYPAESGTLTSSVLAGMQAEWRPFSWLRSEAQTGLQWASTRERANVLTTRCRFATCTVLQDQNQNLQKEQAEYTSRLRASFVTNLGWASRFVSIQPGLGVDFRKSDVNSVGLVGTGTRISPSDVSNQGAIRPFSGSIVNNTTATAGWYLSATIGLFGRLFFDTGLRQDVGSAVKASKNGNTTYPKFGTSWLVSEEPFFPSIPFLSMFRLRGALGYAAVQPDATDIYGRYLGGQVFVNGLVVPTMELTGIGNMLLEPERAIEMEIGFDAELLNERFVVGFTYANKNNKNNLINRSLAPSSGVAGVRKENVAWVRNRVAEWSLTGRVIETAQIALTLTANTTMLDNQVKELGRGVSPFGPDEGRIVEGYPVAGLWRKPVLGYRDVDGDGYLAGGGEVVTGDSSIYMGWMQPRFQGGYGVSLSMFRNLTLDSRFEYQGNYTQLMTTYDKKGVEDAKASLAEQALAIIANRASYGGGGLPQSVSSLRLSSASITYHLPPSLLRRVRARDLSVSFQGRNLGLWTQYRGRDPGVNSTPVGELLQDNGSTIPPLRSYVVNIRWGY